MKNDTCDARGRYHHHILVTMIHRYSNIVLWAWQVLSSVDSPTYYHNVITTIATSICCQYIFAVKRFSQQRCGMAFIISRVEDNKYILPTRVRLMAADQRDEICDNSTRQRPLPIISAERNSIITLLSTSLLPCNLLIMFYEHDRQALTTTTHYHDVLHGR